MAEKPGYDKSIGTEERSVVAATKLWGIVLAVIFLIGVIVVGWFFMAGASPDDNQRNGATRPAGP